MLVIPKLVLPEADAENAKQRVMKSKFNTLFYKNEKLESIVQPNKYFLCGEKGTGKTAFAVFLQNSGITGISCNHTFIRDTELKALINLKNNNRLAMNDYTSLWEAVLLIRIARLVSEGDLDNGWIERHVILRSIKTAIDKYEQGKANPEILADIEILKDKELSGRIAAEGVDVAAVMRKSTKEKFVHYKDLLGSVSTVIKNALLKCKFKKQIIIAIDGLDSRPDSIPIETHFALLSGLGQAAWSLNINTLATIRDTPCRPKIVLLIRPELIQHLGLSNSNLKLSDNAVELNWLVNDEPNYRRSQLMSMINHVLGSQQSDKSYAIECRAWDFYFPFRTKYNTTAFVELLRRSLHRPRDFVQYLKILQETAESQLQFSEIDFYNTEVMRKYSEHLLSEVRNGLEYRLSLNDRNLITLLFAKFKGKREFSYTEFTEIHQLFKQDAKRHGISIESPSLDEMDQTLQLLYESNLIGYKEITEDRPYYRWAFRERTFGNPKPLIEFDGKYQVHDGLKKSLDIGAIKLPPTLKPDKKTIRFRKRA